jgi:hypothetical protein
MKKLLSYFLVVILLLITMISFNIIPVSAAQTSDIDLARQAGQSFISKKTQVFPD